MIKQTIQKQRIEKELKLRKDHPTAEMIYESLKEDLPSLSLATVYRNLNGLVKEGRALPLKVGKENHFDGDVSDHQHCICKGCGKIIDSFNKEITEEMMKLLKVKGFRPTNVIFEGHCQECSKKQGGKRT